MIFAAGLGTRLRPLTNNKPKALVEINGKTLLEITIQKLILSGFDEIIVNVHHFAGQVIDFLKQYKTTARIEISDEWDLLLDTGGGLKKTAWFFNDNKPFLLHNVDIISDIDLTILYKAHLKNNDALATLAVNHRKSTREFLIDENNILTGWRNVHTGEKKISRSSTEKPQPVSFCGIHIINPAIFSLITEEGAFSITDLYLRLAVQHNILAYDTGNDKWIDVGTQKKLEQAGKMFV